MGGHFEYFKEFEEGIVANCRFYKVATLVFGQSAVGEEVLAISIQCLDSYYEK